MQKLVLTEREPEEPLKVSLLLVDTFKEDDRLKRFYEGYGLDETVEVDEEPKKDDNNEF